MCRPDTHVFTKSQSETCPVTELVEEGDPHAGRRSRFSGGVVGAGGLRPPATRFAALRLLRDGDVYLTLEHNLPTWRGGCLLHDFQSWRWLISWYAI